MWYHCIFKFYFAIFYLLYKEYDSTIVRAQRNAKGIYVKLLSTNIHGHKTSVIVCVLLLFVSTFHEFLTAG